MTDALVLDGVSKIYEVGGVELVALHDVDLTVAEEEVVTLLGPSGSGKTTLLSIAGGLLSATTGRVIVGGKNITRARARKLTAFRRKRIGFIFQAVNLVPFLTARENLLVVAELARRDRAAATRRADRLLEELGLGHRMNNLPSQLSGGERQRVAIGRALMNQPALVLVDEPTSALDSDLGQQVMELIVAEVKARGAAAVVVTHDQRMARYGDRILTMADGRIAGMAPRPEFTLGRGPAPAAALAAGPDLRSVPAAAAGDAGGFGVPPVSGRIPTVRGAGRPPASASPPAARTGDFDSDAPAPFPDHGSPARPDTGSVPVGLWANGPAVTPGIDRARPTPDVGQHTSTPQDFASFWGEDGGPDRTASRPSKARGRRGRDASAPGPGTGQHPVTARDSGGFGDPGLGPGTGQVPATAWDDVGHDGTAGVADHDGRGWPTAPGTGQVPATAWDGAGHDGTAGGAGDDGRGWPAAPGAGQVPATAWDGAGHDSTAGGADHDGRGWPAAPGAGRLRAGAGEARAVPGTGQVPATAWDGGGLDGVGEDGLRWGAGPGTGQHPVTARDGAGYGPRTGQGPAVGGGHEHETGTQDGWPDPASPAARRQPPSGQVPIAPPLSGQTPVVPTPDRVWRRPATPPAGRPTGGRRPPPLRPAPTAPPLEGWPEPAPQPPPEPEVPAAPTAAWGTPEFFADPPGSAGHPRAYPHDRMVDDGAVDGEIVDEVETDRVRWLQQLTPPPTKAQPRPLALPDRPIWPTNYWDSSSEQPPANGAGGEPTDVDDDALDDDYDYDFGEYDDER